MKDFIVRAIFLAVIVLLIYFIATLLRGDSGQNNGQACECFEVVGDENNFVCYTPSGEVDTKGECVGPKIYK